MEEQPTSANNTESDVTSDQFNELTDAELPKEMNYQPNRKRVSYTSYNLSLRLPDRLPSPPSLNSPPSLCRHLNQKKNLINHLQKNKSYQIPK